MVKSWWEFSVVFPADQVDEIRKRSQNPIRHLHVGAFSKPAGIVDAQAIIGVTLEAMNHRPECVSGQIVERERQSVLPLCRHGTAHCVLRTENILVRCCLRVHQSLSLGTTTWVNARKASSLRARTGGPNGVHYTKSAKDLAFHE